MLRSNNRDLSGINKDFLCVRGRFGFDFTKHPERIRHPLVRKGDKLYPVSWEEAALTAATKLKAALDAGGKDSIGFIGSKTPSQEKEFFLQKLARTTFLNKKNQYHHNAAHYGVSPACGDAAA